MILLILILGFIMCLLGFCDFHESDTVNNILAWLGFVICFGCITLLYLF